MRKIGATMSSGGSAGVRNAAWDARDAMAAIAVMDLW